MNRKGDGERPLKVGELARRSGVSVRTLHWYDECGLLSPSKRTESGHRLYTTADVARLQRIRSLQQIGMSLEQIGDCLRKRDYSPQRVIGLHLARLREQAAGALRLCQRLERLAEKLGERGTATSEDLLQAIEEMNMYDKYFTPEQMEQLAQRSKQVGSQRIREVEAEWPALMAEVREAMARGDDPAGPHV